MRGNTLDRYRKTLAESVVFPHLSQTELDLITKDKELDLILFGEEPKSAR